MKRSSAALRILVQAALACAITALAAPRPALAAPHVDRESPVLKVPGRILVWQDTTYLSVSTRSVRQVVHYVNVASGNMVDYAVGKTGRGVLAGISPDSRTFLAVEVDSAGTPQLQYANWPYFQWKPLFPVTDIDPHVTWYPDGRAFLYQDILDDSLATPSLFKVQMENGGRPKLFLVGGQRPLLAPGGDAVICVGTDSLVPGPTRDIELRHPVGLEDLSAGGFRWVAPLMTWVPGRGAWSPDGSDVALVGYGTSERRQPERRVYLYSRRTGKSKKIVLPGDFSNTETDRTVDAAIWSPDGTWFAVARPVVPDLQNDRGSVWLISRYGTAVYELKPKQGVWSGAPIWIGPDRFVVGDGSPPDDAGLGRAWIVQISQ